MTGPIVTRRAGPDDLDLLLANSTAGLAHLSQLFVLPDWWGRGVAPVLHDAAIDEMTARGYASARLFTPTLHARARRFYERRGWVPVDEAFNDELRLSLTEYRRTLEPYPPSPSQPRR